MKVGTLFALYASALIAIPAVVLGSFNHHKNVDRLFETEALSAARESAQAAQGLTSRIPVLGRDTALVAAMPPVGGWARALQQQSFEAGDDSAARQWLARLEVVMTEILAANPDYSRVRYLVDANRNGTISSVDVRRDTQGRIDVRVDESSSLQEFRILDAETGSLPAGDIFYSDIVFEHEADDPAEIVGPLIRATVRTGETSGAPGFVVVELGLANLVGRLTGTPDAGRGVFVTDFDGHNLAYESFVDDGPAPRRATAGPQIPPVRYVDRLQDVFPALAFLYDGRSTEPFSGLVELANDVSYFVHARRVALVPGRDHSELVLGSVIDSAHLLAAIDRLRLYDLLMILGVSLVGAVGSFAVSRLLTGPLRRLTDSAARVAAGEYDVTDRDRLPTQYRNEFGDLARAFLVMTGAIRSREALILEGEAQRAAIFDTAGSAILIVNGAGRIERANPAAHQLFGYDAARLPGVPVKELLSESATAEDNSGLIERITGEAGELPERGISLRLCRKGGSTFPAHVTISRFQWSGEARNTWVVTDLSERERADRLKDEFVSTVSHELRTPLTSIKGSLGLLNSPLFGALPGKAKSMIEIAYNNSSRLVRLINDLLDIEKISAGKMRFEFERTELRPYLIRVVEDISGFAADHDVAVALDPVEDDLAADFDPDRIDQVITNLLSNAIKYSPHGETVTLSARREDGTFRVDIADRGRGIPKEFQDRIFGRFSQADSPDSREKGGTGLGLSICKDIVEAHGGTIWFEPGPDAGTVFSFRIPLALTRSDSLTSRRSLVDPRLDADKSRVLVCDDDPDDIAILKELVGECADVDVARTCKSAAARLSTKRYDLVIIDLLMPDDRGESLFPVIDGLSKRPGVMIYSIENLQPSLKVYADACHVKSGTTNEALRNSIESLIRRAERGRGRNGDDPGTAQLTA